MFLIRYTKMIIPLSGMIAEKGRMSNVNAIGNGQTRIHHNPVLMTPCLHETEC